MRIYRLVIWICLLGLLMGASIKPALASSSWSAQPGDVKVTWGELWTEVSTDNSEDHSWLKLELTDDHKLVAEYYVWKLNSESPEVILNDFAARFRANAYEQPVVTQIFSFGASRVWPKVVEFNDPTGEALKEYLTPSSLVGGYSMVTVFQRPVAFDMSTQPGILDDIKIDASYEGLDPFSDAPTASRVDCTGYADWRHLVESWLKTVDQGRRILSAGNSSGSLADPASAAALLLDPLLSEFLSVSVPEVATSAFSSLAQAVSAYDNGNLAEGDRILEVFLRELSRIDNLCK